MKHDRHEGTNLESYIHKLGIGDLQRVQDPILDESLQSLKLF